MEATQELTLPWPEKVMTDIVEYRSDEGLKILLRPGQLVPLPSQQTLPIEKGGPNISYRTANSSVAIRTGLYPVLRP